jgi:hypothetical protein
VIHYAALGDSATACGLPCRAPTEDEHGTGCFIGHPLSKARYALCASLDPRLVDCIDCAAEAALAPRCACGAPALYGAARVEHEDYCNGYACGACNDATGEPRFCAEHAPPEARCQQCDRPLVDASESFCERCLFADPDDTGDGITRDPAGLGCGSAY